jgi:hypothetical protein
MRPGQNFKHNNRQRGRGRRQHGGGGGGGGGGNPLSRVYESNGPDVKVRGTAQTVAEKYLQLGRDAQSAGDNVMAESYYQHAEHYFRILAAAQAYQQQLQQQYRGPEEGDEEGEEAESAEGEESSPEAHVERPAAADAEEQPDIMGFEPQRPQGFPPAQVNGNGGNNQQRDFRPRNEGNRFRNRFDRNRDRQGGDQGQDRFEGRPQRQPDAAPAVSAPAAEAPPEASASTTWSEDSAPSFLRRGRRPRRERTEEGPEAAPSEPAEG